MWVLIFFSVKNAWKAWFLADISAIFHSTSHQHWWKDASFLTVDRTQQALKNKLAPDYQHFSEHVSGWNKLGCSRRWSWNSWPLTFPVGKLVRQFYQEPIGKKLAHWSPNSGGASGDVPNRWNKVEILFDEVGCLSGSCWWIFDKCSTSWGPLRDKFWRNCVEKRRKK